MKKHVNSPVLPTQPAVEGHCSDDNQLPEAITLKDIQDLTAALPSPPFEQIAAFALACFDDVVEVLGLEGEYRGKEFVAYNPKRNDTRLGSFQINSESGKFGDFAVDDCKGGNLIALAAYCWGCGNADAAKRLLDELDKRECVNGRLRPHPRSHVTLSARHPEREARVQPIPDDVPTLVLNAFVRRGESLEDRYDYTNQSGLLCFVVLRIRGANGGKTFRPLHVSRDSDGTLVWRVGMPVGQRPLFGLLDLNGTAATTTVFVVEGEKAALALQKLLPDTPVLTSAGGAMAARKTDWSSLAGRDVVIWPDNDDAGLNYAREVIALIRSVEPTTPIAVVNVEAVLRAICGMKGWIYDDKREDLKGWDAADIESLVLDASVILDTIEQSIEALPIESNASGASHTSEETRVAGVRWESGNEYRLTGNVVQIRKTDKDGEDYWANVCSRIDITRQLRDDNGFGWSLELVIHTPDGSSNTIVLPRSRLSDAQTLKADLHDKGVLVYNWNDLQGYLGHAIPHATHKLVRSVGWHEGVYVQSGQAYGLGTEPLALDGAAPACTGYGRLGDLETWNAEIGQRCIGNSRLMLAVCAALGGPLLHLVGVESGGLHLVGPSSVGKTTALRVAASVWGRPDGFIRSWRSTSNGLESVAAGLNDGVLLIDEMNQATPQEAGEAVYMLGNGQGKTRMTRHGVGARLLQWRLVFISTGEIPLQHHLESAGKSVRAGMEIRLLNIPANAGFGYGLFDTVQGGETSQALADYLRVSASNTYGVAGDAWLTYMTGQMAQHGREAFCEMVQNRLAEIESQFSRQGADGQVTRAARRFALLALAGEMAGEAGIGGWAVGDATAMMLRCFDAWITERGGLGSGEEAQALRQVQHFFEQHGQSSFQRIESSPLMGDESASEYRTISQRAGYYRQATDEFYVLAEPFRNRVCAGLNSKLVARVLRGHELLLGGSETATTVRLPGLPNSIRAYRISGRIVGFDPDGQASNESEQSD